MASAILMQEFSPDPRAIALANSAIRDARFSVTASLALILMQEFSNPKGSTTNYHLINEGDDRFPIALLVPDGCLFLQ